MIDLLRRRLVPLVAVLGALLLAEQSYAQIDIECGPERCLVPVERLTHQDTRPFVLSTRILTEEFGAWESYGPSIRRIPDARDCLTPDQRQREDVVDLLAVDWSRFRLHQSASVCLFRIFSTLDNLDLVEDWARAIEPDRITFLPPEGLPLQMRDGLPQHAFWMSVRWGADSYYERWPSLFNRLTGLQPTTSFGFQVFFAEDETVIRADMTSSSWWN